MKERERNSIGCFSYTPQLGTKPETQACTLIENGTGDLLLCGMMPNHLSQLVRAGFQFLTVSFLILTL